MESVEEFLARGGQIKAVADKATGKKKAVQYCLFENSGHYQPGDFSAYVQDNTGRTLRWSSEREAQDHLDGIAAGHYDDDGHESDRLEVVIMTPLGHREIR